MPSLPENWSASSRGPTRKSRRICKRWIVEGVEDEVAEALGSAVGVVVGGGVEEEEGGVAGDENGKTRMMIVIASSVMLCVD